MPALRARNVVLRNPLPAPPPWLLSEEKSGTFVFNFIAQQAWDGAKKKVRPLAEVLTCARASAKYVDDSQGNWNPVLPNALPLSDKGLSVEGAQTNSIRNNSMQGAVPGTSQNAIRNNSMQGAVAGTSQNAIRNNSMQGVVVGQSQNAIRNNTMQGAVLAQSQNAIRNNSMQGAVPGQSQNAIRNNSAQGAVAGQSQNAIRNNSMQGAVAGSPGTPPNNWSISNANGLVRSIIGSGSINGIDYIDVNFSGTASASGNVAPISFEGVTTVAATQNQIWTFGSYVSLLNGTAPQLGLRISTRDSSGNFAGSNDYTVNADGNLSRYLNTATLTSASTAFISPQFIMNTISGITYNFTVRIGSPTLEQAPGAGPATRTTGTAANFSSGTFPTNWGIGAGGGSASVVGTGTENGFDFIDIRFFGLSGSGTFRISADQISQTAAANTYTYSKYLKVISGSLAPVGSSLVTRIVDISPTTDASGGVAIVPGPNLQRFAVTKTVRPDTTVIRVDTVSQTTASAPYDIILRFASPQLEQSTVAGPVTRTTGTAAAFSAGTLPTNWIFTTNNNPTMMVIGTGTENGFDYIDLRVQKSGPEAGGRFFFDTNTSAVPGQNWTGSGFYKFIDGSLNNVTLQNRVLSRIANGTYLNDARTNFVPTNSDLSQQRISTLYQVANTATQIQSCLEFSASGAYDFTIRIGSPQLEQSLKANSVTRTTGAAAAMTNGALPSNWFYDVPLGSKVVGFGVEDGIDYIDLSFSGTNTGAAAVNFESTGIAAASSGQIWSSSCYYRLMAGSLSNVTFQNGFATNVGGTTYSAFIPTNAPLTTQRQIYSATLTGTPASIWSRLRLITSGVFDFTIRIGLPQLEQAPGAGPVTRTTGTAASAIVGSLPTNWGLGTNGSGLVYSIAGKGVEDNLDYVDIRFYGIASVTQQVFIYTETTTGIPLTPGQLWTNSSFVRQSGGSLTNINGVQVGVVSRVANGGAGASTIKNTNSMTPLTNAVVSQSRMSVSNTLNDSNGAFAWPLTYLNHAAGPVDITIRFASPQMEQSYGAGPVTRTTGTAVAFSAGTLPTNWSHGFSNNGVSVMVARTGTLAGVDYADIRVFGVATAAISGATLAFETNSAVAASTGQVWTHSLYGGIIAGAVTGQINVDITERTSNSVLVTSNQALGFPSNYGRVALTATLNGGANTAVVVPGLRFNNIPSGANVDVTIRIGLPQLEQFASAGPVSRTTGTAAVFASGTLPTNWIGATSYNGVNRQVVGTGVESGIDYVDVRFFGTTTAALPGYPFLSPESNLNIAGASGQLWTGSIFAYIVGGSTANITVFGYDTVENGSTGNGLVASGSTPVNSLTGPLGLRRLVNSRTFNNANTVYGNSRLIMSANSGVNIDITVRLGWPQLEQWNTAITTVGNASSPIRTTGTAATRAADYITTSLTGITNSVTLTSVFKTFPLQAPYIVPACIGNDLNNYFLIQRGADSTVAQANGAANGVSFSNPAIYRGTFDDSRHAIAGTMGPSSFAISLDGNTVSTGSASSGTPNLMGTKLTIGSRVDGNRPIFGFMERLAVLSYQNSNDNAQRLASLATYGG